MSKLLKWIDKLPLLPLVVVAVFFAIVPLTATPHLAEKIHMLLDGTLSRPIDIFDLFMHSTPLVLLVIRVTRIGLKK